MLLGGEGRHVEDSSDPRSSSLGTASAPESAAIVVVGGNPDESSGLLVSNPAEFGNECEEVKRGVRSYGFDLCQPCEGFGELLFFIDHGFDAGLDGCNVSVKRAEMSADLAGDFCWGLGVETILLHLNHADEFISTSQKGSQPIHPFGCRLHGRRMILLAEECDNGRINLVGLRQNAFGTSKISNLLGVEDPHGNPSPESFGHQQFLVPPR